MKAVAILLTLFNCVASTPTEVDPIHVPATVRVVAPNPRKSSLIDARNCR